MPVRTTAAEPADAVTSLSSASPRLTSPPSPSSAPSAPSAPSASAPSGRPWRLLWTADTVSVLGDGAFVAALPLLASRITHDPRLVAGLAVAGTLPWLLFSLPSGALADRSAGRPLFVRAQGGQLLCVALIGLVALAGAGGAWRLPVLYALAFSLGTAAALAKAAAQTLIPSVVAPDQLVAANGRMSTTGSVARDLAGPALGSVLFAAAPALPFWVDALTFAASAALLAGVPRRPRPAAVPGRRLRSDIREGVAWLMRHRLLRSVTLITAAANFGNQMGYSTLVLFVGPGRYGLLLSLTAVGGVLGGLTSRAMMARFGGRRIVRVTTVVTPLAMIAIGLLGPNWIVVGVLTSVGAMCAALWSVAAISQRQRLVPAHLQSRVAGAATTVAWGSQPLGALAGGLLAGGFGLAAPWIVGGVLRLLALAVAFRALRGWTN